MVLILYPLRSLFYLGHETQGISAVNSDDIVFAVALFEQRACEVRPLIDSIQSFRNTAHAIEVAPETDRPDAGNIGNVIDVLHYIRNRRVRLGSGVVAASLGKSVAQTLGVILVAGAQIRDDRSESGSFHGLRRRGIGI
jgi:hypothetical protein